jgi:hypothetical protein
MAQSRLVTVVDACWVHHGELECGLNMSFGECAMAKCANIFSELHAHAVAPMRELLVAACTL